MVTAVWNWYDSCSAIGDFISAGAAITDRPQLVLTLSGSQSGVPDENTVALFYRQIRRASKPTGERRMATNSVITRALNALNAAADECAHVVVDMRGRFTGGILTDFAAGDHIRRRSRRRAVDSRAIDGNDAIKD